MCTVIYIQCDFLNKPYTHIVGGKWQHIYIYIWMQNHMKDTKLIPSMIVYHLYFEIFTVFLSCVSFQEPECMCPCVLLPCTCLIEDGCPLHGIYFSLRTTSANTRGGNHKWEEESATGGKGDLERVYWRKESKGEEGMGQMSASWELFLISQAESCALSPESTHSGLFLVC